MNKNSTEFLPDLALLEQKAAFGLHKITPAGQKKWLVVLWVMYLMLNTLSIRYSYQLFQIKTSLIVFYRTLQACKYDPDPNDQTITILCHHPD